MKVLGILGLSPFLQTSACRVSPLLLQRESLQQCVPFSTSTSQGPFSYRIAASFSAKGRRFVPKGGLFSFDPHNQSSTRKDVPKQRPGSGQDAFFVSSVGNSTNVAFGVADGVGGWSDSGIDSAHFSHGLCQSMSDEARDVDLSANRRLYAGELLQKGYNKVIEDKSVVGGGTTACIAVGGNDGNLEVAKYIQPTFLSWNWTNSSSLGDSGFVQLRPNKIHYSSNPQTHAFNTPYQLSIIPPRILARSKIFGGEPLHDYPNDASITSHQVRHGDVLVFATDGVWDNLSSADLLKIVSRNMTGFDAWKIGKDGLGVSDQLKILTQAGGIAKEHENTIQAVLAVAITSEAKMASVNSKVDGPFAREVQKFYPHEDFHGGKVDDICVVVAVVIEDIS